jgi:hypothetical protein
MGYDLEKNKNRIRNEKILLNYRLELKVEKRKSKGIRIKTNISSIKNLK